MDLFFTVAVLPIALIITFFIGAPIGLILIWPVSDKIIYLILLIGCIGLFRLALKWGKTKKGKSLMVFSLLLWLLLSCVGASAIEGV